MPWEYSDRVLQLFQDAVQGAADSHMGEIPNADGCGEHGSMVCGDALKFTFRVQQHPTNPLLDIITEARYLTFGCTSAIAASEALCTVLERKAKTPIEALQITNQDLVDDLGGLPEQKIHCSVMGAEALHEAVKDWAQKRGVDLHPYLPQAELEPSDEGRIVCRCFSITEPYLRRKILELGLKTIPEITHALKAGGGCTSCHHATDGLQDLLDEIWGSDVQEAPSKESTDSPTIEISPYRLGLAIEQVFDKEIRPKLQQNGGDVSIVDIKDNLIYCRFSRTAPGLPDVDVALKDHIEHLLRSEVDPRLRVIALGEPS